MDHFYDQLPGWCDFAELYADQVARAKDGAHFVEVGTYLGKSAAFMAVEIANSGKRIAFDACDTFVGVNRENFDTDHDYLDQESSRDDDGLLLTATRRNLEPVSGWVNLRVGESLSLAETYADDSLDFVFLDDDHSTAHVLKELDAWYPKVKPGGAFAGHDINWPSVAKAVEPWSHLRGLRVVTVGTSWAALKPARKVALTSKKGSRKCLVAVCSNERSVYRQTASSLMNIGWGQRVTDAAKANGFSDVTFAWVSRFVLVSDLRNEAVKVAIASGCTHILFLDADMVWPTDVLTRMLKHHDKGIVSGLYFLKQWPHWPVALKRPRVNQTTHSVDYDYDKTAHMGDALIPEALVGMGCTLVPMSVCQAMPEPWFEYRENNAGQWTVTEDVPFCQKAAALGCPIYVDPTVKCGHVSQQVIAEPWYERSLAEMAMLQERQAAG